MIFHTESWLWKSCTFWHLPTTPIREIRKFFLGILLFAKNFVSLLLKTPQQKLLYYVKQNM